MSSRPRRSATSPKSAIYIAADNSHRAVRFVQELRAAAERLGDMPRAFPLLGKYERAGVRRHPYRDYLVFYRIDTDRLVILRVLHGARDNEDYAFQDA